MQILIQTAFIYHKAPTEGDITHQQVTPGKRVAYCPNW